MWLCGHHAFIALGPLVQIATRPQLHCTGVGAGVADVWEDETSADHAVLRMAIEMCDMDRLLVESPNNSWYTPTV